MVINPPAGFSTSHITENLCVTVVFIDQSPAGTFATPRLELPPVGTRATLLA
jgi:hypothetical protein